MGIVKIYKKTIYSLYLKVCERAKVMKTTISGVMVWREAKGVWKCCEISGVEAFPPKKKLWCAWKCAKC